MTREHDGSKEPHPTNEETGDHNSLESSIETHAATIVSLGVVGVGVAVVEAALLPGVILGAAAMVAPKFFPSLFKSTVRGAYKLSQKTREFVAEAQEQVNDIVAEVDAAASQNGADRAPTKPPTE
jgi:hypothetical protein